MKISEFNKTLQNINKVIIYFSNAKKQRKLMKIRSTVDENYPNVMMIKISLLIIGPHYFWVQSCGLFEAFVLNGVMDSYAIGLSYLVYTKLQMFALLTVATNKTLLSRAEAPSYFCTTGLTMECFSMIN